MTINKAIFKLRSQGGTGIINFNKKDLWKYKETIKQYGNNYNIWIENKPFEPLRSTNFLYYSLHYNGDMGELPAKFWNILYSLREGDNVKKYKLLKPITLVAIQKEKMKLKTCKDFRRFVNLALLNGYKFNDEIPISAAIVWAETDFLFDTKYIEEIKSEVVYSVGDHFKNINNTYTYFLTTVGSWPTKVQLITTDYNNFYCESAEVKNKCKITQKEFNDICNGESEDFTLITC